MPSASYENGCNENHCTCRCFSLRLAQCTITERISPYLYKIWHQGSKGTEKPGALPPFFVGETALTPRENHRIPIRGFVALSAIFIIARALWQWQANGLAYEHAQHATLARHELTGA